MEKKDQSTWAEWSIYVLKELERLEAKSVAMEAKIDKLRHFRTTMVTIWLVTDFLIMLLIAFKEKIFK